MIHVSGNPINSSLILEDADDADGGEIQRVSELTLEMEISCNLWSLVLLEVCERICSCMRGWGVGGAHAECFNSCLPPAPVTRFHTTVGLPVGERTPDVGIVEGCEPAAVKLRRKVLVQLFRGRGRGGGGRDCGKTVDPTKCDIFMLVIKVVKTFCIVFIFPAIRIGVKMSQK